MVEAVGVYVIDPHVHATSDGARESCLPRPAATAQPEHGHGPILPYALRKDPSASGTWRPPDGTEPQYSGKVPEPIAVERRTLLSEVWSSDQPWFRLLLDRPLLLEAGQKYWLDQESETVVVEDADGNRRCFSGHQGDAAERPR